MASPQSWFYRGWQQMQAAARGVAPAELAPRAHAVTDALVADSPDAATRACAAGCDYCCHYPVGVTAVEAEAIVAHLLAIWPAARLEQFARIVAREARAGLDWQGRAAQRRPCVLLSAEGRCQAYEHRPVACRGWHSRSRAACESAHDGCDHLPAVDGAAYAAALGVNRGLAEATGDAPTRELTDQLWRLVCG